MPMRWAGIDEAGYGPNLGPLVMTAVLAEGPGDRAPDVWADLGGSVTRAGGRADALWIDDSKRLYRGGRGLDRLEAATLAAVAAAAGPAPGTLGGLLMALGAGGLVEAELLPWLDEGTDPAVPSPGSRARVEAALRRRPLEGAPWRLVAVRSVVVGPARFNAGLAATDSKAAVHFAAFAGLLGWLWAGSAAGDLTRVNSDKHGGRHYYLGPLAEALPDAWIEPGAEGPGLSAYTARSGRRRLELALRPRADAADGLVALASIVSKAVRERWMAAFNDHWTARVPGLRPTAGYPGDAARFRAAIEPECRARGLATERWWRAR